MLYLLVGVQIGKCNVMLFQLPQPFPLVSVAPPRASIPPVLQDFRIELPKHWNSLYVVSYIRHEDFFRLSFVTLRVRVPPHPLDSETGCTGELWSNRILLILEPKRIAFFLGEKKNSKKKSEKKWIFEIFWDFHISETGWTGKLW